MNIIKDLRILLLFWLITLCAVMISRGQDAKEEGSVPDPPHLGAVPPFTQWTVTATPKKPRIEAAKPEEKKAQQELIEWQPFLEKVVFQKDDNMLQGTFFWEGARQTEAYLIDSLYFSQPSPRRPEDITFQASGDMLTGTPDYEKTDFPDLAWVGGQSYVDTIMFEGRRVHLYEQRVGRSKTKELRMINESVAAVGGDIMVPLDDEEGEEKPVAKVWIDPVSRYPIASENRQYFFRYSYSAVPGQEIELSPVFARYLENLEAERTSAANQQ